MGWHPSLASNGPWHDGSLSRAFNVFERIILHLMAYISGHPAILSMSVGHDVLDRGSHILLTCLIYFTKLRREP